jgi:hypothetical protein
VNLVEPLFPIGAPLCSEPQFHVHHSLGPARAEVEHFVQRIYYAHYGATIRRWMPVLVSLSEQDRPCAAAGYRPAHASLFLERYLGEPVEDAIARVAGVRVARSEIVEVGHFASELPGRGRRLMVHLGRHLAAQGFRWVVSTATLELRTIFERMRIRPHQLARADAGALGAEAVDWGSYYEHAPAVLAGEIHGNLARFAPAP